MSSYIKWLSPVAAAVYARPGGVGGEQGVPRGVDWTRAQRWRVRWSAAGRPSTSSTTKAGGHPVVWAEGLESPFLSLVYWH